MKELQTILGTDIPLTTRGIVYLCYFDNLSLKLEVCNEILCDNAGEALDLYANIPNPESQLATGETFNELIINLHKLHENMKDESWLLNLANCL